MNINLNNGLFTIRQSVQSIKTTQIQRRCRYSPANLFILASTSSCKNNFKSHKCINVKCFFWNVGHIYIYIYIYIYKICRIEKVYIYKVDCVDKMGHSGFLKLVNQRAISIIAILASSGILWVKISLKWNFSCCFCSPDWSLALL